MKMKLTVRFRDDRTGEIRELSGTYSALAAMTRKEWAERQRNYVSHDLEPVA